MSDAVFIRKKVFDPITRLLHWVIALSIFGLGSTGFGGALAEPGAMKDSWWEVHMQFGTVFSVALVSRLLWMIIGPKIPKHWGHPIQAKVAYLGVYGLSALSIASGWALAGIEHHTGPLTRWFFDDSPFEQILRAPHSVAAWLFAAFVIVHIGAMTYHEIKDGLPVAQGMVSGFQYKKKEQVDEANTSR